MTQPPPFKAEKAPPRMHYTCYRCGMQFQIRAAFQAEKLTCSDCKLPFWTGSRDITNIATVGVEPQDVPA